MISQDKPSIKRIILLLSIADAVISLVYAPFQTYNQLSQDPGMVFVAILSLGLYLAMLFIGNYVNSFVVCFIIEMIILGIILAIYFMYKSVISVVKQLIKRRNN